MDYDRVEGPSPSAPQIYAASGDGLVARPDADLNAERRLL